MPRARWPDGWSFSRCSLTLLFLHPRSRLSLERKRSDGNESLRATRRRREWDGPALEPKHNKAQRVTTRTGSLGSFLIASPLEFRSAGFFGTHHGDDGNGGGDAASANVAKDAILLYQVYTVDPFSSQPAPAVFLFSLSLFPSPYVTVYTSFFLVLDYFVFSTV